MILTKNLILVETQYWCRKFSISKRFYCCAGRKWRKIPTLYWIKETLETPKTSFQLHLCFPNERWIAHLLSLRVIAKNQFIRFHQNHLKKKTIKSRYNTLQWQCMITHCQQYQYLTHTEVYRRKAAKTKNCFFVLNIKTGSQRQPLCYSGLLNCRLFLYTYSLDLMVNILSVRFESKWSGTMLNSVTKQFLILTQISFLLWGLVFILLIAQPDDLSDIDNWISMSIIYISIPRWLEKYSTAMC